MKKYILPALCVLLNAAMCAQDNYTMKMTVKTEGLPPEYAAYGEQEIITWAKGDKSKTEISSAMFNSTVWFDGSNLTSVTEAMGNKSGFTATKEQLESEKEKNEAPPKIEYLSDKKTIAGYECTKAIVTNIDKEKKERVTIVWITEKIKTNPAQRKRAGGRGMPNLGDLKGHPLSMEMTSENQGMELKTVMTTTEVLTTPIDDAVFVPATEGIKMMTYQEWKDKMKMQGGGNCCVS